MTDTKPTLVWALYLAGIAAVLTPFIAVGLAYAWRRKADAQARAQYDTQIRVFWRCGAIWLGALVLMVLGFVTDTQPVGSGTPLLFNLGLLVGIVAQLWFTARSLVGLIKCFITPATPMAAA